MPDDLEQADLTAAGDPVLAEWLEGDSCGPRLLRSLGLCNITKCCTEVCPAGIKITNNTIIPMKERAVGPLRLLLRSWNHLEGKEMYIREYAEVFAGDERWRSLPVPAGNTFAWDPSSTYVRRPPFFDGLAPEPGPLVGIEDGRVLALLGDSVTTDHISPAGAIKADSAAGGYLVGHGVQPRDFNSYGSRRGNHEVMIRGTFANIRLRNQLAPGTEGGFTRHLPSGEQMTIFDAAQRYAVEDVPLLVIAGREYGSGSSRDWAAKGTALLGVRAVLAVSFERIHRSNLIGMGVLPLQFASGQDATSLGLTGEESYAVRGLAGAGEVPGTVTVAAAGPGGIREFAVTVRIDTPAEAAYYRRGGILPYVLRDLTSR